MLTGLKGTGKCGCVAHKRLYGKLVFVFCGFSGISRTDRIRYMNRLVEAALLKYRVGEALGIVFDADNESEGYDLRWDLGHPQRRQTLKALQRRFLEEKSKHPLQTLSEKPDHTLLLKAALPRRRRRGLNCLRNTRAKWLSISLPQELLQGRQVRVVMRPSALLGMTGASVSAVWPFGDRQLDGSRPMLRSDPPTYRLPWSLRSVVTGSWYPRPIALCGASSASRSSTSLK